MLFLNYMVHINFRHEVKTLDLFGQFSCNFIIEGSDESPQIAHFAEHMIFIIKTQNFSHSQDQVVVIKAFLWYSYQLGRFCQVQLFAFVKFSPFFDCYNHLSDLPFWFLHSFTMMLVGFTLLMLWQNFLNDFWLYFNFLLRGLGYLYFLDCFFVVTYALSADARFLISIKLEI